MTTLTGFYRPTVDYKKADTFQTSLKEAIERAKAELPDGAEYSDLIDSLNVFSTDVHNIENANKVLTDALAQARDIGVDDHLCIAVESVRPGILDPNIRMYAGRVPSKTNVDKVVVALESASRFGKFAIVALILAVIIKIISWVLNNGGSTSGKNVDVDKFNDGVKERIDKSEKGKLNDDAIKSFDPLIVDAAYTVANTLKDDNGKYAKLLKACELLEGHFKTHPGLAKMMVAIGAKAGTNPLSTALKEYIESGNSETISNVILNQFRTMRVLDIFYNPKTVASLYSNKKVMAVVGPNRRMPTVTMIAAIDRAILDATSSVPSMRKLLSEVSADNITDVYGLMSAFLKDHVKGRVFEQPKMSNSIYETPFTSRMSENKYSEGFHPLGQRLFELSETGSIGKSALQPIYEELSRLPENDLFAALGGFCDVVVEQNGKGGRFADVIDLNKHRAKQQKIIIDGYSSSIDKVTDAEAKGILGEFREWTNRFSTGVATDLKTLDGERAEPLDVIIDHAKLMRSLWETSAALTQCAEKHNNASDLMDALAKACK